MSYYDAVTVSSNQTKVNVKNLDSGTNYLMRVVSVNAHGSEPKSSKPMEVKTIQGKQTIPNNASSYWLKAGTQSHFSSNEEG
jgi:hypothetical protein